MKTERNKERSSIQLPCLKVRNICFFWISKNMAFGQLLAAMLSSAEFFIMDLFGNLLQWHFAIICPAFNKRITFSSHLATFSCKFVMNCFLPLEDSVTLKQCPVQNVLWKSNQNQTETLKLTLVSTFDVEFYSQHTLKYLLQLVSAMSRNTRDDVLQCHCSYPQRTGTP